MAGALKIRQDWRAFGPLHDVRAIRATASILPSLAVPPKSADTQVETWTDIPTHDPFSFDRNDTAIVIAPPAPPTPLGPKPILFGIYSLGTNRIALLASGSTPNRNSRPVKIGESIDGWTVTDVSAKQVKIESNGVSQLIGLDDIVTQVPRDYSRTLANSAPVIQPPASSPTPAPTPAASSSTGTSPASGQKHTHIEFTPFGPRVVQDPSQQ
jgi:hypothetical protein